MRKKTYLIIVVFYTVFNIGLLINFNIYIDSQIQNIHNLKNINDVIVGKDNVAIDEDLKQEDQVENSENKEEPIGAWNSERAKINIERQIRLNDYYENDVGIVAIDESQFDIYNKEMRERNKVLKVPADEIINDLSAVDKAKIMIICKDLTEEDYLNISGYLEYTNEKLAVTKTLNILEDKVEEEKVNEIKVMFSKYIDMDKVEED